MPSRQYVHQTRNMGNGMCKAHKSRPIYKWGVCEECYRKCAEQKGCKREYPIKSAWAAINWSRHPIEIAEELGVKKSTVYSRRAKHNRSQIRVGLTSAEWLGVSFSGPSEIIDKIRRQLP